MMEPFEGVFEIRFVATRFVGALGGIQSLLLEKTPRPILLKIVLLLTTLFQFIPLFEYAIVFVPSPTAIHIFPLQVTPRPLLEKKLLLFVTTFQFIPLLEYPIVFIPFPTTTQIVPFQAIS